MRHCDFFRGDDGDLKFTTDLRSVSATVLEDWFGTPAENILGPGREKLELIDSTEA